MKTTDIKMLNASIAEAEAIIEKITRLRDTLQEQYDNKSEKWQESEKGEAANTAIEELTGALDNLESAKDSLGNVVSEAEGQ
jgi:hypothetical protein